MSTHWLFTWTTYASRLPGDARGTTTSRPDKDGHRQSFNVPGERPAGPAPELETWTANHLRERPVALTRCEADIVLESIQGTARYQRWRVPAVAVMYDHVHLVVDLRAELDRPGVVDGMRRFKAYASRALNAEVGHRERWWTRGGSRRALTSDLAVAAAVRYVATQRGCLARAIASDWSEVVAPDE